MCTTSIDPSRRREQSVVWKPRTFAALPWQRKIVLGRLAVLPWRRKTFIQYWNGRRVVGPSLWKGSAECRDPQIKKVQNTTTHKKRLSTVYGTDFLQWGTTVNFSKSLDQTNNDMILKIKNCTIIFFARSCYLFSFASSLYLKKYSFFVLAPTLVWRKVCSKNRRSKKDMKCLKFIVFFLVNSYLFLVMELGIKV